MTIIKKFAEGYLGYNLTNMELMTCLIGRIALIRQVCILYHLEIF